MISVIVPIYNVEKYLSKCIESIINQTYKDLEIILVNDGSLDNCPRICDEYAKKDNRIKVIHKENGGVSTARNIGLDKALGDYIFFVDSDDYLDLRMIEVLYNNMKKYKADISMCNYIRVDNYDVKVSNNEEQIEIYSNIQALNRLYKDTYTFHEDYALFIAPWNKLYKKELFDNLRYPIGKIYEDGATIYKVLYKSNKIVHTNQILYYYYQSPNSISRKKFDKTRLDRLDAFKGQMEFYKDKGLNELYFYAFNTYLNMFIEYYSLANIVGQPEMAEYMKNKFKKEFKKAKKELNLSKERIEYLNEFLYPKLYGVKAKIKREGLLGAFKNFVVKRIKR